MFGRSRSNHQILFRLAPINLHLGLHGSGSAYSLSGFNVQVRLLFRALALGLVAVDGFLALCGTCRACRDMVWPDVWRVNLAELRALGWIASVPLHTAV
jgi:hypothetical protein